MPREPFEVLADNYPSNSKKSKLRQQTQEEPEKKKVVTGTVRRQKAGFGKKLSETFLEENAKNAGGYIIHDVFIPALKSLVCDMVGWGGMAEMILFGGQRGNRGKGNGRNRSYTSYDRISYNEDRNRRDISRQARSRHDLDEIVFTTRGDADEVLARLIDEVDQYDFTTVADFYDLAGVVSNFTDHKYGWTDLSRSGIVRRRNGYVLDLPRPELLD